MRSGGHKMVDTDVPTSKGAWQLLPSAEIILRLYGVKCSLFGTSLTTILFIKPINYDLPM